MLSEKLSIMHSWNPYKNWLYREKPFKPITALKYI